MTDLSLVLPSRGRPALLRRFLRSARDTAARPSSLEVVLYRDEDDPVTARVGGEGLEVRVVTGPRASMGQVTRSCLEASRGEWLFFVNDDAVFRTREWDEELRRVLGGYPDGVALAHINDAYYGDRVCTFPAVPRKTAELMEGFCPAAYRRHCIDTHVTDVFSRLASLGWERRRYLPGVVLEHLHYELACAGYGKTPVRITDTDDQEIFRRLAPDRQRVAGKMAEYLRNAVGGREGVRSGGGEAGNAVAAVPVPVFTGCVSVLMIGRRGRPDRTRELLRSLAADNRGRPWSWEALISLEPGPDGGWPEMGRGVGVRVETVPREGEHPARWVNRMARRARGDYFAILDAGDLPAPGWLAGLLAAVSGPGVGVAGSGVGVVGSLLLQARSGRVEQAGWAFCPGEGHLRASALYAGAREEALSGPGTRARAVTGAGVGAGERQAVSWSGMLVSRECWAGSAGFDENLAGGWDIDLCLAARARGRRVVLSPWARLETGRESPVLPTTLRDGDLGVLASKWPDQPVADSDALFQGKAPD